MQLSQALSGKFNAHVHVEYEWCLQHEDLDESDEDLDEKVRHAVISVRNKSSLINTNSKERCNFKGNILRIIIPQTEGP